MTDNPRTPPRRLLPLEDGLLAKGDRGKISLAIVPIPSGDVGGVAYFWDTESKTPVCDHRLESDTLISWLEYHKAPEDRLCPQCHHDSLSSVIANEKKKEDKEGRVAIELMGLSGIIQRRTALLQEYAYAIWFDFENLEKRSEIRDALGFAQEEWVISFRRSSLWTEEKEKKLSQALLEDTLNKMTYSIKYRGEDTEKDISMQRTIRTKSEELRTVIAEDFDPLDDPKQDPSLSLKWFQNWYSLNECYLDYISEISYQIFRIAAAKSPAHLLGKILQKGNECMVYSFQVGRTLERVIRLRPREGICT